MVSVSSTTACAFTTCIVNENWWTIRYTKRLSRNNSVIFPQRFLKYLRYFEAIGFVWNYVSEEMRTRKRLSRKKNYKKNETERPKKRCLLHDWVILSESYSKYTFFVAYEPVIAQNKTPSPYGMLAGCYWIRRTAVFWPFSRRFRGENV